MLSVTLVWEIKKKKTTIWWDVLQGKKKQIMAFYFLV